jgi:hypothetical protein
MIRTKHISGRCEKDWGNSTRASDDIMKHFINFLIFHHPDCKESLLAKTATTSKGLFPLLVPCPPHRNSIPREHLSPLFDEDELGGEVEANSTSSCGHYSSSPPCDVPSHYLQAAMMIPSSPPSLPPHLEILEDGSSSSKSGDGPGTPCFEPPCISSSILLPSSKSSRRSKKKIVTTDPFTQRKQIDHRSPLNGKKRSISFVTIVEENVMTLPLGSSSCSDRGGSSPPHSRSSSALPFSDRSSNHFQSVFGSPNIPIESLVLSPGSSSPQQKKRSKSVPLQLNLDFEVCSSPPSCSLLLPPKCTRGRSASYTDELAASLPPFLPPSSYHVSMIGLRNDQRMLHSHLPPHLAFSEGGHTLFD